MEKLFIGIIFLGFSLRNCKVRTYDWIQITEGAFNGHPGGTTIEAIIGATVHLTCTATLLYQNGNDSVYNDEFSQFYFAFFAGNKIIHQTFCSEKKFIELHDRRICNINFSWNDTGGFPYGRQTIGCCAKWSASTDPNNCNGILTWTIMFTEPLMDGATTLPGEVIKSTQLKQSNTKDKFNNGDSKQKVSEKRSAYYIVPIVIAVIVLGVFILHWKWKRGRQNEHHQVR